MNKPKTVLSGAGFYIAMLLCLAIVGVSGYMILFGTSGPSETVPPEEIADADVYEGLDMDGPSLEILEPELLPAEQPPEEREEIPAMEPEPLPAVDDTPVAAKAPSLIVWPLRGEVVAAFSVDKLNYDATMGDWRTHAALDLAAAPGTQVMASCAGTVSSVENDPMLGTSVVITHDGGYQTTYANLQTTPAVEEGDGVTAGQIIGAVGATAIAETALPSHLHFAVEKDGEAVDPATFLKD